jgi:hypothetical protein
VDKPIYSEDGILFSTENAMKRHRETLHAFLGERGWSV